MPHVWWLGRGKRLDEFQQVQEWNPFVSGYARQLGKLLGTDWYGLAVGKVAGVLDGWQDDEKLSVLSGWAMSSSVCLEEH